MNQLITNTIFADAGHRLVNVGLPKELIVYHRYGRAFIAVDERNQVRDAMEWRTLKVPDAHPTLADPFMFWKHWGQLVPV